VGWPWRNATSFLAVLGQNNGDIKALNAHLRAAQGALNFFFSEL